MVFTYWLNYGLVQMIEFTSSNAFISKNGGDLSRFVGMKIILELMLFIAVGLLMEQGADNIIGRGQVGLLKDVFGVDLQLAIQRTRQVMNFCIARSKRDAFFPLAIDFSILQQGWVAANQTLGVLLTPINRLVNPNDITCPSCLDLILSQKFWDFLVRASDAHGVLERVRYLSLHKKWDYQVPYMQI
jgi:hypothetical protein